jgi:hypothetical protein
MQQHLALNPHSSGSTLSYFIYFPLLSSSAAVHIETGGGRQILPYTHTHLSLSAVYRRWNPESCERLFDRRPINHFARRLYGKRPSKARAFTGVSNWSQSYFFFFLFFLDGKKIFTIPRLTVRCPGASGIFQSNFFVPSHFFFFNGK